MGKRSRTKRKQNNPPLIIKNLPDVGKKLGGAGVDIVCPIWGQFPVLAEGLGRLDAAAAGVPYKVYLVDDVSPDLEKEGKPLYNELKKDPKYNITYHKQNQGFGKSCNDGASLGSSKYILITSTDVILTENSIKIMYEHIENNPQIGIVAPKLLFFPNSNDRARPAGKVQSVGIFFGVDREPYHPFSGWDADAPLTNVVRDVNAITGACFLIRRSVWNQLHGFSTDYGRGTFEDIDISLRTRMLEYVIRVLPQAVGFHYTNLSVLGKPPEESFPLTRNHDIYKAKFGNILPYDCWYQSGVLFEEDEQEATPSP